MEVLAKLVCFPPLGQLTVIGRKQREIEFTVLLEASKSLPEVAWEVSVWHNCPTKPTEDSNTWENLPLVPSANTPFTLIGASAPISYNYSFSAPLKLDPAPNADNLAYFTIKFRAGPNVPWQWMKDQFGISDGSLLFSQGSQDKLTHTWASSIFGDEHLQQWQITSLQSQAPGATLFKVESKDPIPRNSADDAKYESKIFGSSNTGFCRYMALVRIWSPWLAPRHGERRFHITEDALLCSFLTCEGQHAVLLPINGVNDTVTVFRSDADGHIIVAARNDGRVEGKFEFLAAVSDDFEVANAAVMYEARRIILQSRSSTEQVSLDAAHVKTESIDSTTILISKDDASNGTQSEPKPQWLEEWYDGLTYCTWNSLGQDLTEEKLFVALDDLAANGIHVSGLIIDDNWQSLDGMQGKTSQFQRGWTDFEANNKGFPQGLKPTVAKIKDKHPAISNVAVWHGLHGYWGGISPSGTIAKSYKTIELEKDARTAGGKMLAVDPSDIHQMYDDFYKFLASCGVTSVKTDVQFYLDLITSTADRRAFTTAYQSAWTTAHLRHFSGKAISCMSQIPQILFQSFLAVNTPRILLRNSDDFFPTIPASHPWHIFCNAHNALFVQHLNVLPDWDMFQTSHPYSSFHAAARCVSGGPIYITDTPGDHDLDLIAQFTAQNVRGQTVILRPSVVGKTIDIYDPYYEGRILKVGTYNGAAQTGNGILGLFNVSDHEISALIPITDFPGVHAASSEEDMRFKSGPSGQFLIRSHVKGQISQPITPTAPTSPSNLTLVTLPIRGYDILTVHPIYEFSFSTAIAEPQPHRHPASTTAPTKRNPIPTSIAILGLLGKMTGACAITSTYFEPYNSSSSKNLRMYISLKALGTLGIWMSDLGERSVEEGFLVTILGKVVPRERVERKILGDAGCRTEEDDSKAKAGVLEIDLLGAWKDMGLESRWSNEVSVGVFIHSGMGKEGDGDDRGEEL
ncbi:hypothetical protein EPUS_00662 [Endocarpon pusillum Z07020]|uniref:Uncharacterized protein n=1 Tax=Endocarpon pusillum (strain Z07020 / HMAS-L-300199) TaxID=1263415 RepID=U1GHU7_ENDPU|nr:uncharacterized protein EPUS_00662 [Endocarpon pusillum Z07020]ERF71673.1 hypothetical protein EPUS_00662 [Endocarpon pusillum Z07020]